MAIPAGCPLKPRQFEVVQHLAEGIAPKNIATRLGISHSTVRSHIDNACRALDVHGVTGLVTEAGRRGWVGWVGPEDLTPVAVEHPWLGAYLAEFDSWLASGMCDARARNRMRVALGGHRERRRFA